ncbi:MAG: sulfatase-like hydrolase/transferase [Candidatus Aminicenantes bacterium]|nr:sulfatase-like hydrolase/transferase [Candidatus Aminicenantes bacterium]
MTKRDGGRAGRDPGAGGRKTGRWLWIALPAGLALAGLLAVKLVMDRNPLRLVAREWGRLDVDKPNVVVLTLDTTRADHLAPYGYGGVRTPVLDALAARGTLFEECASVTPLTLPSHSTIFTGFYPTYHGVRVNGNTALGSVQTTLAEVLAGRGYACGAFIGAFVLDGRWGLNQGFEHYDDKFDLKKYKQLDLGMVQRPGNQVVDAALGWLEGRKDKPFFAWIHLYDPHLPYAPPEPYLSSYGGRGLVGLYDGEIAFMDSQIGRVRDWLERSGLDRRTVVVLVGDHGEALGSHGESSHGYFIYDYAVHVPFLIVAPFRQGRGVRVPSQVSTVDVFATVLDLVKIPVPEGQQGRSLVADIMGRAEKTEIPAYSESFAPNIQFGWAPLQGLRTTRYKFISAPRLELYDLERDPDEAADILDREPAVARDLKDRLDRLVEETGRNAPQPQAADLDKETVTRLAALGYIGAPVAPKKAGAFLADPKDKLAVFESVQRAGEMIQREEYGPAADILEATLKQDPEISQALLLLATCRSELGRKDEAKAALDVVLARNPENIQALISLANIFLEEGRAEDVVALCKRTLAVDDRSVQAYMLLGEVYMAVERREEALPNLEKAYEIQPKLTQNGLNLAACWIGLKRYDRAEPLLVSIVRDNPKFPFAQFNLGLLYEEQGRWEEARKAYSEEIAVYASEYKARFNLGKVLLRLGDREGYLAQMREVVSIAPKQAEGHLFLARGLLAEPGTPLEEIRGLVDKGLELAKTDELKALGYFLLADIYHRMGQPDRVRAALEKANAYKPKQE